MTFIHIVIGKMKEDSNKILKIIKAFYNWDDAFKLTSDLTQDKEIRDKFNISDDLNVFEINSCEIE